MLPPVDRAALNTLITELLILADHAHARGERATVVEDYLPDYWRGMAKAYENAIERFEALLNNSTSQPGDSEPSSLPST